MPLASLCKYEYKRPPLITDAKVFKSILVNYSDFQNVWLVTFLPTASESTFHESIRFYSSKHFSNEGPNRNYWNYTELDDLRARLKDKDTPFPYAIVLISDSLEYPNFEDPFGPFATVVINVYKEYFSKLLEIWNESKLAFKNPQLPEAAQQYPALVSTYKNTYTNYYRDYINSTVRCSPSSIQQFNFKFVPQRACRVLVTNEDPSAKLWIYTDFFDEVEQPETKNWYGYECPYTSFSSSLKDPLHYVMDSAYFGKNSFFSIPFPRLIINTEGRYTGPAFLPGNECYNVCVGLANNKVFPPEVTKSKSCSTVKGEVCGPYIYNLLQAYEKNAGSLFKAQDTYKSKLDFSARHGSLKIRNDLFKQAHYTYREDYNFPADYATPQEVADSLAQLPTELFYHPLDDFRFIDFLSNKIVILRLAASKVLENGVDEFRDKLLASADRFEAILEAFIPRCGDRSRYAAHLDKIKNYARPDYRDHWIDTKRNDNARPLVDHALDSHRSDVHHNIATLIAYRIISSCLTENCIRDVEGLDVLSEQSSFYQTFPEIPFDRFVGPFRFVGSGSYSTVTLWIDTYLGIPVCIKSAKRQRLELDKVSSNWFDTQTREAWIMTRLTCQPCMPYVIGEYAHIGALSHSIIMVAVFSGCDTVEEAEAEASTTRFYSRQNFSALTETDGQTVKHYIKSMIGALLTLSKVGIVHQDIKPGNFLYAKYNYLDIPNPAIKLNLPTAALIDYGLAGIDYGFRDQKVARGLFEPVRFSVPVTGDKNSMIHISSKANGVSDASAIRWAHSRSGTKGYRAPEVLLGWTQSEKSDVFSVGICLLQYLLKQTGLFRTSQARKAKNSQNADGGMAGSDLRTMELIYELMSIRNLLGAEPFFQLTRHCGVTLLHTFAGTTPSLSAGTLADVVRYRNPELYKSLLAMPDGDKVFDLAMSMIAMMPADRFTAFQCLEHPFLK